jgi:hypothetical protein
VPVKSVEHSLTALRSIVRGLPRRAQLGEVDTVDLATMRTLRDDIDTAIADTVAVLLDQGANYGDIGRALGMTRQGARQLYGRPA